VAGEIEKDAIESAQINADLFLKYRMPDRDIDTLREVAERFPNNTDLRWQLTELYMEQRMNQSAGEELVALANIYVKSNQFDFARLALLKLKEIYPGSKQVDNWIASLDQQKQSSKQEPILPKPADLKSALAGDLSFISLFDIIQAVEKNQITGIIHVRSQDIQGNIYFNRGLVADVILGQLRGKPAFKRFAEITEGSFELEKSPVEFQPSITTTSNAQLILEIFSDAESEETTET
jgi:hypothetical protein